MNECIVLHNWCRQTSLPLDTTHLVFYDDLNQPLLHGDIPSSLVPSTHLTFGYDFK